MIQRNCIHFRKFAANTDQIVLIQHIITQAQHTSTAEWLAFVFGVAQVVLALKNKTLNFYAGIISVSLYIYIFYSVKLYAESLLNVYYLLISIAGIFIWSKRNRQYILPISRTTRSEWLKAIVLFAVLFPSTFLVLKTFSPSDVPGADALVSALAWVGTWLMIKRKLENWLVLNASNALAIPLFIYKSLELTAILTLILFVVAVFGYFRWKKEMTVS